MGQAQSYRKPIKIKDLKAGTCFLQGSKSHHNNTAPYERCKKLKRKYWTRRKNGSRSYSIEYENGGGMGGFREDELVGKCKCPMKTRKRKTK